MSPTPSIRSHERGKSRHHRACVNSCVDQCCSGACCWHSSPSVRRHGIVYARIGRANWARLTAAPEVQRLLNHGDYTEAFLLVREALQAAPDDPALHQLWLDASIPVDITTDPPGADVELAGYRMRASPWLSMGRTPLDRVRMPRGQFRMRISKAGFQPIDASGPAPGLRYKLDPPDAVPSGMVRVTRGRDSVRFGLVGELDEVPDRSIRGHQPAVQGIRRSRRLPPA